MSDISWTDVDIVEPQPQGPQGPLGNSYNIEYPDPWSDIGRFSEAIGPGTAEFNGLDRAPPRDLDVNSFLQNEGIQEMVQQAENPEDMRQRVENAVNIAKMLDITPSEAMQRLGYYSEALYGTQDQRTVWEQTMKALKLGVEQTEYSMLGMQALLTNNEEVEKQLREFQFTDPGDESTFVRKVINAAGPQVARFSASMGSGAVAGAAAAAAAAPFGMAKPAFLWTFPKTTMTANMMMEAGFLYGQLLSAEGANGERISRGTAKVSSLAYGAAAGFLETMGQKLTLMPGGMRFVQGLSDSLGTGFISFVSRTAARFATASVGEGATEFTQELAQGYASNIAAAVENARQNRIYNSQDFIEDQVARGELDQDTATAMLNNHTMLSNYIEEQGGREELGIGERPGEGVFPLSTQHEIFQDASTAFVSAMITGGVFGAIPSVIGGVRDTKAKSALKQEISTIVQDHIKANPDADLETIINGVMEDPLIQTQSQRFIRAAAELAIQRENDPERVHAEMLDLKQRRAEWRREDAEDAVTRRFNEQYKEETRPEVDELYQTLREQQAQEVQMVEPEDAALSEFIEKYTNEQKDATDPSLSGEEMSRFVQTPELDESLKQYWLSRRSQEQGVSTEEYQQIYRQRTLTMAATVEEVSRAARYVSSEAQQTQLLQLANSMQETLNDARRTMSLPNAAMATQQEFSEDVRQLQRRVTELETVTQEDPVNAQAKDDLATARAELQVAELRAKDAAQIASRIQENVSQAYTFIDEETKALSEIGVTADEVQTALSAIGDKSLEDIILPQDDSKLNKKIKRFVDSNAKSIMATKTRDMHTPYAKGIEFIKKQITKRRGDDKANSAIREALAREIAETGRLNELYSKSQINEILSRPANEWTPMEMMRVRNLVDMLAEVGRREARIAQEKMAIRAEATRRRLAENIDRLDEYIQEADEQLLSRAPERVFDIGPKRLDFKLDDEQVELVNKFTSLGIDTEQIATLRAQYNENANLRNKALGSLKEAEYDFDGFETLFLREELVRYQAETTPASKTINEHNQLKAQLATRNDEIMNLAGVSGNAIMRARRAISKAKEQAQEFDAHYQEAMNALREEADIRQPATREERRKRGFISQFIFPHVLVDTLNGKRARYQGLVHETFITNPVEQESQAKGDVKERLNETLRVMDEQNVKWNDMSEELVPGVTVQQAMYYYLANKNESFASMVKRENNLGNVQWTSIIEALDDSYKKVADKMHQHLKESYDEIRDVGQRVYGRNMGFIDEWLPLYRETQADDQVDRLNIFETFEAGKELDDRMTLSRAKSVTGHGIRTDLASLYFGMVPKQRRFIRMAESMAIMKKVLLSNPLKRQITEKAGGGVHEALDRLYDRYADPNVNAGDSAIDRAMRKATRNLVATRLFFNLSTMTKQVPSMLNYIRDVGPGQFTKAMAKNVTNWKESKQLIFDLDPYIANRVMQIGAEELTQLQNRFGTNAVKKIQEYGLSPVRAMDQMVVFAGWRAAYDKGLKKFGNKEKAIQYARELTIRSQPDANPATLPDIYTQNAWSRFFLAFTQQPYKNLTMLMYDMPSSVRRTWEENAKNGKAVQAAAAATEAFKWSTALGMQALMIAALTGVAGVVRGYDEERDWQEGFLADVAMNVVGWLPIAGSALSSKFYGFEPSTMPFQMAGEAVYLLGRDILDGEMNYGTIRSLADVTSMVSGVPANRVLAVWRYMTGD